MLPVALQLWSIRDEVARDFAGTMRQVAAMGYSGVEIAGFGNLDLAAGNQALRDAGLRVAGMHVSIQQLRADVMQVAEQACTLGCGNLVCPWYPPHLLTTPAAYEDLGEELNRIGARLRAVGLRFHYHHHDFELRLTGGRHGLDWLVDACEPRNVAIEADVYWLKFAGVDPAVFLREQGRRVHLVHLKDEKELGSGPVDFGSVFQVLDAVAAVEWLIVEQEQYTFAPLVSVQKSFDALRAMGRA